jgi:hypothetical protein
LPLLFQNRLNIETESPGNGCEPFVERVDRASIELEEDLAAAVPGVRGLHAVLFEPKNRFVDFTEINFELYGTEWNSIDCCDTFEARVVSEN